LSSRDTWAPLAFPWPRPCHHYDAVAPPASLGLAHSFGPQKRAISEVIAFVVGRRLLALMRCLRNSLSGRIAGIAKMRRKTLIWRPKERLYVAGGLENIRVSEIMGTFRSHGKKTTILPFLGYITWHWVINLSV